MVDEHEAYGPDETDFEAEFDHEEEELKKNDLQMKTEAKEEGTEGAPTDTIKAQADIIEDLKQRLAKMEQRTASMIDPEQELREEADGRSIYVGNVDYSCSPEELQQHFQACGIVNRVTILTDRTGQPKGFAYVEFAESDAIKNALQLNESELHGRPLKVLEKRTNVPGVSKARGRRGGRARRSFGRVPRFRRPRGFRPY